MKVAEVEEASGSFVQKCASSAQAAVISVDAAECGALLHAAAAAGALHPPTSEPANIPPTLPTSQLLLLKQTKKIPISFNERLSFGDAAPMPPFSYRRFPSSPAFQEASALLRNNVITGVLPADRTEL